MRRKFALLTALLMLGVVTSSFVEAQAVILNVSTRWLNNNVLTSRLVGAGTTLVTFPNDDNDTLYEPMAGDDEAVYVDADLNITTNTQFWAVQVDCTATNTMLETYEQDTGSPTTENPTYPTDNPGDNLAVFTPNLNVTGTLGINAAVLLQRNTTDKGKFSVSISRISSSAGVPFGVRGITNTYLIGTIRLRVKPQLTGAANSLTFKGLPILVCTSSFVDRNGASVGAATYTAPKPLSVIAGYSINGTAKYQAQTNHAGITVYCGDGGAEELDIQTDAMGNWKLSGFRATGNYSCWAYGNKVNPSYTNEPDAYLPTLQSFVITNDDVQLLPVKLLTGDVENRATAYAGSPPFTYDINSNDLAAVTANYNTTTVGSAYRVGDANGDAKVDRSDLALVTSNYGLLTTSNFYNGVLGDHIVLSAQTNSSAILADNRIVISDGPVTIPQVQTNQWVAGINRDFWATVSPNGKQIAFSRSTGTGAAQRYQVFVAPIVSGVVGAPVRVSTGTTYDESAPSWSPDGLRLAYTCSPVTPSRAIQVNSGSLCLSSNPGGAVTTPNVVDTFVKIYPAAWQSNTILVYGATIGNVRCGDSICRNNLNGQILAFSIVQFAGGDIEDMPVIRGKVMYYRSDDTNLLTTASINAITLDAPPLPTTASSVVCSTASFHVTAFIGDIDYYTLQDNSYDMSVMTFGVIGGNTISPNANFLKYRDATFCPDPIASTNSPSYVFNGSLNIIGLNPNIAYNPANPSDIYATRISLQWLP